MVCSMANYNTFAVVQSKSGKILLVTSSARKASEMLCVGRRVEVWNENERFVSITYKDRDRFRPFIRIEKDYIRRKQEKATIRNQKKHGGAHDKTHNQMQ